jgi:hypothetical protein
MKQFGVYRFSILSEYRAIPANMPSSRSFCLMKNAAPHVRIKLLAKAFEKVEI